MLTDSPPDCFELTRLVSILQFWFLDGEETEEEEEEEEEEDEDEQEKE